MCIHCTIQYNTNQIYNARKVTPKRESEARLSKSKSEVHNQWPAIPIRLVSVFYPVFAASYKAEETSRE